MTPHGHVVKAHPQTLKTSQLKMQRGDTGNGKQGTDRLLEQLFAAFLCHVMHSGTLGGGLKRLGSSQRRVDMARLLWAI